MTAFTVHLDSAITLTDQQFYQLCRQNPDLRLERTAEGNLVIMAPTGGETGNRNGRLTQQLFNWADENKLGIAFDSSTGFKLPNGANRSPDAAWIAMDRWQALTTEQREQFVPLCPDFVVELMSPSDSLSNAQEKMAEYLNNGLRLGWLINRKDRSVEIYRSGHSVERLDHPTHLSGETVLEGFLLQLTPIW
jgi:Uma2 family endonuclease